LIKELQSLALDVKVLRDDAGEIEIKEDDDDGAILHSELLDEELPQHDLYIREDAKREVSDGFSEASIYDDEDEDLGVQDEDLFDKED
jgi:DNA-directed RNA polymerase subunit beta